MKTLSFCKFAHSVRIDGGEKTSVDSKHFKIELEFPIITVTHIKSKDSIQTTVFNTPYFKTETDSPTPVATVSTAKKTTKPEDKSKSLAA